MTDFPLSGLREIVDSMLMELEAVERRVLRARYGLWEGEEKTLEEVGKLIGVTRERVRQLQARAEKNLKKTYARQKATSWFAEVKEKSLPSFLQSHQGLATAQELSEWLFSSGEGARPSGAAFGFLELIFQEEISSLHGDWKSSRGDLFFVDKAVQKEFETGENLLTEILHEKGAPISLAEAVESIRRLSGLMFLPVWLRRVAQVSRTVGLDDRGLTGLREWDYFVPKTRSEMAQRVLLEIGRPAHVREILEKMNAMFPERAPFSERTIHSMLTEETEVFVSARRAVYGLASWNLAHAPTIRDFIIAAIERKGGPISVDELMAKGKARYGFRSGSVQAVLRDTTTFREVSPGAYGLVR